MPSESQRSGFGNAASVIGWSLGCYLLVFVLLTVDDLVGVRWAVHHLPEKTVMMLRIIYRPLIRLMELFGLFN